MAENQTFIGPFSLLGAIHRLDILKKYAIITLIGQQHTYLFISTVRF